MSYNITLTNGSDLISGGLLDNTADSTNSSLTLVGKNYKGYGLFLNQNFVRLMENFANSSAPTAPLPGQLWFNSSQKVLNFNIASSPTVSPIWKSIPGMTLSSSTPTSAFSGEMWYDTVTGQLKLYTGSIWRTIGPIGTLATGNSGAIPDTVIDVHTATTYIVIKFYIDDILVGIWSKEDSIASNVFGFETIKKGLNLHSTLGHTFWGNASVANSLYVNGAVVLGDNILRKDVSGVINGALSLTNDSGLSFGVSSDFVGSVTDGTVTLRNQSNNRDLILSVKSAGVQTSFLKGNAVSGLAEVFNHPSSSSSALSVATKNYVDTLAGSVTGLANFSGHIVPTANLTYTIGNSSNRWSNIFSENILVGNVYAANTFATLSNVSQVYLGADITPTSNTSSNIGSSGMFFNTLHSRNARLIGNLTVSANAATGNLTVTGTGSISSNLAVTGNVNIAATTPSALTVSGGASVGANLTVSGTIFTPTLPPSTSNTAVATTAFVQSVSLPSGSLMMWPASVAPSGWLLCSGAAISRSTYAALFAVIGTTFGAGDGSTTFNLPDYTNRSPVGAGGLYSIGATGGSKDAVVVSHTHTATSTATDSGHTHTYLRDNYEEVGDTWAGSTSTRGADSGTTTATSSGSANVSVTTTINSAGVSGTNANMPPYLVINFIIKI